MFVLPEAKHFMDLISLLHHHNNPMRGYDYLHSTDETLSHKRVLGNLLYVTPLLSGTSGA